MWYNYTMVPELNQNRMEKIAAYLGGLDASAVHIRTVTDVMAARIYGLIEKPERSPALMGIGLLTKLIREKLQYRDYWELVVLLNAVRDCEKPSFVESKNRVISGASGPLREALRILASIHERQTGTLSGGMANATFDASGNLDMPGSAELDKEFAEEALLLIRSLYPYGINMMDAQWTKNRTSSHDANLKCMITSEKGKKETRVFISPLSEDCSLIEYNQETGADDDALQTHPGKVTGKRFIHQQYLLRDGESVILGRSLGTEKIFGEPVGLRLDAHCNTGTNNLFSRAGIRIIRKKGQLYFFDAGCKNTMTVTPEQGQIVQYVPPGVRIGLDVSQGESVRKEAVNPSDFPRPAESFDQSEIGQVRNAHGIVELHELQGIMRGKPLPGRDSQTSDSPSEAEPNLDIRLKEVPAMTRFWRWLLKKWPF